MKIYRLIWGAFSNRDKFHFVSIIFLTILVAILELISVGAVVPFLAIFNDPNLFISNYSSITELDFMKNKSIESLRQIIVIGFISIIIISSIIKVIHIWAITYFSELFTAKITAKMFKSISMETYLDHVNINSSSSIAAFTQKVDRVAIIILNFLLLISSILFVIAIVALLLVLYPAIAIITGGFIGLIYGSILIVTRGFLNEKGSLQASLFGDIHLTLREFFSSIKETILYFGQNRVYKIFYRQVFSLRKTIAVSKSISMTPKFLIESLGILCIILYVSVSVSSGTSFNELLPAITVMAFSAQKLLPAIQQIFNAYATIINGTAAAVQAFDLINQNNLIQFNKEFSDNSENEENVFGYINFINVKNLSFSYGDREVLKNINFKISRKENVAIVGGTGSGKSTLMDCLMGLNNKYNGNIEISGIILNELNKKSWMKSFSHVPQSIFLFDTSLKNNVTLFEEFNDDLFKKSINAACLNDLYDSLGVRSKEILGEDGALLSGGQRQRIGIARALYKNPDILMMDEPTSALDEATEAKIYKNIRELFPEIQIICITHRQSIANTFDVILNLSEGKLKT